MDTRQCLIARRKVYAHYFARLILRMHMMIFREKMLPKALGSLPKKVAALFLGSICGGMNGEAQISR